MRDTAIKHHEFTRPVAWLLYHGSEQREATFLAATDASGVIDLRLVWVQGDTVPFSRRECLFFAQPVEAWEAEALAAMEAEPASCSS